MGTKLPFVRPLALDAVSQFRPDGPLPLNGLAYAFDLWLVKELGRADSSLRTEEQTRIALFWTDHDIPQWNRNLMRLADARGLSSLETARLLAMAHVAGGDAMIGCFEAKYHYLSWRPVHAIQRANTDGNPLTTADPAWQPLRPTPNHPEYPSAHACHTTAIAEALKRFFGTDKVRFSLDSLVTGETRSYERFKDAVQESQSRACVGGLPLPQFRPGRIQPGTEGRTLGGSALLPAGRVRRQYPFEPMRAPGNTWAASARRPRAHVAVRPARWADSRLAAPIAAGWRIVHPCVTSGS